jgi:hypothetical protein
MYIYIYIERERQVCRYDSLDMHMDVKLEPYGMLACMCMYLYEHEHPCA